MIDGQTVAIQKALKTRPKIRELFMRNYSGLRLSQDKMTAYLLDKTEVPLILPIVLTRN